MENTKINIENIDWTNLETRSGSVVTSELNVPAVLKALLEDLGDIEGFNEFWPNLYSEGVAWSAAYAAVPFVVSIAKGLTPEKRMDHLFFIANVECCKDHDCEVRRKFRVNGNCIV